VNRRRREPSYRPIVLIDNASREQVIAINARKAELGAAIADANDDLALEAFLKSARQQGDGKSVETGDEGDA
jgi:hypothetical protein